MLKIDTSKYYIQTSQVWNDEESPLVRILSYESLDYEGGYYLGKYSIIHHHLGAKGPVRLIVSELEFNKYFRLATDEEITEQLLKWGI